MHSDKLYKYLGVGTAAVLFLWLIASSFRFQTAIFRPFVREGQTGMDISGNKTGTTTLGSTSAKTKISDTVVQNTSVVDDALVVSRYRKAYEDIILDMDTNCKVFVLDGVINNAEKISENPMAPDAQEKIKALNNVDAFRTTLDHAMKYLKDHP
jgi:hypothetical protein